MYGERESGHDVKRGEEDEIVGEDAKSKGVRGTSVATLWSECVHIIVVGIGEMECTLSYHNAITTTQCIVHFSIIHKDTSEMWTFTPHEACKWDVLCVGCERRTGEATTKHIINNEPLSTKLSRVT